MYVQLFQTVPNVALQGRRNKAPILQCRIRSGSFPFRRRTSAHSIGEPDHSRLLMAIREVPICDPSSVDVAFCGTACGLCGSISGDATSASFVRLN